MRFFVMTVFALALAVTPAMVVGQEVSDDDLQTFASIYKGMEQARAELSQEMAAAESPEQTQELRDGANERMIAVIEENGWDIERYNQVASAINEDEDKRSRVLEILQSDS